MKRYQLSSLGCVLAFLTLQIGGASFVPANDSPMLSTLAATPEPKPRAEALEQLTPQERAARLKALRERSAAVTNRVTVERLRAEWKRLSLEDREARLQQWREELQRQSEELQLLTIEQREAKRQVVKDRFENEIKELQRIKAAGRITREQERRLERLEQLYQRFLESGKRGSTNRPAAEEKPADTAPKP